MSLVDEAPVPKAPIKRIKRVRVRPTITGPITTDVDVTPGNKEGDVVILNDKEHEGEREIVQEQYTKEPTRLDLAQQEAQNLAQNAATGAQWGAIAGGVLTGATILATLATGGAAAPLVAGLGAEILGWSAGGAAAAAGVSVAGAIAEQATFRPGEKGSAEKAAKVRNITENIANTGIAVGAVGKVVENVKKMPYRVTETAQPSEVLWQAPEDVESMFSNSRRSSVSDPMSIDGQSVSSSRRSSLMSQMSASEVETLGDRMTSSVSQLGKSVSNQLNKARDYVAVKAPVVGDFVRKGKYKQAVYDFGGDVVESTMKRLGRNRPISLSTQTDPLPIYRENVTQTNPITREVAMTQDMGTMTMVPKMKAIQTNTVRTKSVTTQTNKGTNGPQVSSIKTKPERVTVIRDVTMTDAPPLKTTKTQRNVSRKNFTVQMSQRALDQNVQLLERRLQSLNDISSAPIINLENRPLTSTILNNSRRSSVSSQGTNVSDLIPYIEDIPRPTALTDLNRFLTEHSRGRHQNYRAMVRRGSLQDMYLSEYVDSRGPLRFPPRDTIINRSGSLKRKGLVQRRPIKKRPKIGDYSKRKGSL